MPPFQTYNPIIIGFVEGKGYLNIPLRTARDKYRRRSSDFGLVPQAPTRHPGAC